MIQQEWFKASGNKLSNPSMVEDYLNSFNEMSHDLLKHVVNMADANVSNNKATFSSMFVISVSSL